MVAVFAERNPRIQDLLMQVQAKIASAGLVTRDKSVRVCKQLVYKLRPKNILTTFLPSLFGEKPVKSYFLPLGYQCEKKPDENSCCDYLCVAPEDADWKIFEGCWHSFHSECLKDLTYCPICSNHLNNVLLSLSESANSSFVNGGKETDDVETTDPQSDDDTDDDEMESDNLGISINESNIENILNDITLSVMHLSPQSPPHTSSCLSNENLDCSRTASNLLSSVQLPKRSPHCSTCQHTRIGHGMRSSTAPYVKCTMCPNNVCMLSVWAL